MASHYLTQSFRSMLTPLAYFPVGEDAKTPRRQDAMVAKKY